ncbi:hypothetical protein Dsin_006865 [Dipteronia sinensis]|uniref:Brf1 TBP-binding domain-containing protein n=1 Tax=Dipteronia sinensis TaxID=43782 RepID=A0AAE0EFZ6_9ROSI|nr:hypothetical protein Dsin_006865 [Dipteronia sinensis]
MGVCHFCNKKPAGYLFGTSEYLCRSCFYRYLKRNKYSVAKIKQNGRRDDSFFQFNSWEKLIKKWDRIIKDVPDGDDADNFSDSDAFEIDDNLLNEDEKHYKNIIQEVMKWQYFKEKAVKEAAAAAAKEAYEKLHAVQEIDEAASNSGKEQAAKEAAVAAAKEAYEDLNAVQEIDVAASNSRKERQQKRAAEAGYPASAESASEANLRMLAKKRLSSKINDDVLEEVYNDLVASENTKRRDSESHSDNGNKRQESQVTLEIGELELEGYYDNGSSVRRRGIWKPNGFLRKCSRKLS